MSWHHGDYINLASAAGTVIAAGMALFAARDSLISSKNNMLVRQRDLETKGLESLMSIAKSINDIGNVSDIRSLSKEQRESLVRLICLAHVVIVDFCISAPAKYRQKDNFMLLTPPNIFKSLIDQKDHQKTNNDLDFGVSDFRIIERYRLARKFFKELYQAAN
ncbi:MULTISPECIES: hypothetical protein [unclassified Tatumella]|uniref:hypothetical protein n=1 Tax=unclassified Tatumella TaxID=2649542 RepID=UPI001BB08A98|nr:MULTISPECIES: hypothetical protein [unclassified Tatumella]MBS0878461.1 hypothetical protein [Tatumella sp. JGM82]MBS0892037.1 hypothetical protein [Tatumella sp. JGM94]MBS0903155.1 hypothetical protein [Tatumella sp. JGM100]